MFILFASIIKSTRSNKNNKIKELYYLKYRYFLTILKYKILTLN